MSTLESPIVPLRVLVQLPLPSGNLLLFRIELFGVIYLRYGLKAEMTYCMKIPSDATRKHKVFGLQGH